MFASTSKITFPGSGVALMASSQDNVSFIQKQLSVQTIGPDKINQLRHLRFFKNPEGLKEHMKSMQRLLSRNLTSFFRSLMKSLVEQASLSGTNQMADILLA